MTVNQSRNAAGTLAFDTQSLEQLKLQAKRDPDKAIAGVAKQFEGMFLGMVLKSMREATPQTGMFDNEQTKLYTSLLDQQLAQHIAARGTGLAEVMARQMTANAASLPVDAESADASLSLDQQSTRAHEVFVPEFASALALAPAKLDFAKLIALRAEAARAVAPQAGAQAVPAAKPLPAATPAAAAGSAQAPGGDIAASSPLAKTRDFIQRVWHHALDAAQSIGIKPQFMVGQAALESGWGQHEIRNANGTTTHNLFGIKAGKDWTGPVVERTTTEYVDGVAQKTKAKFRAYSSYAESFRDYANLLHNNPRYAGVVNNGKDAAGFARGLQKAGYATDPEYANKLMRLINGPSLKQAAIDMPVNVAAAKIDTRA